MTKAETGKQELAFALDAYDSTKPLVIDPQVIYATYLGGISTSTVGTRVPEASRRRLDRFESFRLQAIAHLPVW